jgi:hypothetical protein
MVVLRALVKQAPQRTGLALYRTCPIFRAEHWQSDGLVRLVHT